MDEVRPTIRETTPAAMMKLAMILTTVRVASAPMTITRPMAMASRARMIPLSFVLYPKVNIFPVDFNEPQIY